MRWLLLAALLGALGCKPGARPLVVFAASSLTDAFGELERSFEAESRAEVSVSFAGSHELRLQIDNGAPADVFASADLAQMAPLVAAGRVEPPSIFAKNTPVVAVRRGGPELRAFADLPAAERIVVGAPEVPIGAYTSQILAKAGADFQKAVEAKVVSKEANVRQVLAKLTLGEADAAIVYESDAVAAGLPIVEIPEALSVVAEYPIAVVSGGQADLARAFVAFVRSSEGRRVLEARGFLAGD